MVSWKVAFEGQMRSVRTQTMHQVIVYTLSTLHVSHDMSCAMLPGEDRCSLHRHLATLRLRLGDVRLDGGHGHGQGALEQGGQCSTS